MSEQENFDDGDDSMSSDFVKPLTTQEYNNIKDTNS